MVELGAAREVVKLRVGAEAPELSVVFRPSALWNVLDIFYARQVFLRHVDSHIQVYLLGKPDAALSCVLTMSCTNDFMLPL